MNQYGGKPVAENFAHVWGMRCMGPVGSIRVYVVLALLGASPELGATLSGLWAVLGHFGVE